MKSGFCYIHCNRCFKFRSFEELMEDNQLPDDCESSGIRYLSCTCGNKNIKLVLSNIALEDEY